MLMTNNALPPAQDPGYSAQVVDQVCPPHTARPWKSWFASIALHAIAFALLAGVVLIPAADPSKKAAFTVDVSSLREHTTDPGLFDDGTDPNADPDNPSDPANLPEPLPEFDPGDTIAPSTQTNADLNEALAVAATNPGMGELIQLPASVTAPRLLPQANGTGAGNVFGAGSGFAGSGQTGGGEGGGGNGAGGVLVRPGPASPPSNLDDQHRGQVFDGWIYLGKDQHGQDTFVDPRKTMVLYQDGNIDGRTPDRERWLAIYKKHRVRIEPMGYRWGNPPPHGPRDDKDPFIANAINRAIAYALPRPHIRTLIIQHKLPNMFADYPPHVRKLFQNYARAKEGGLDIIYSLLDYDLFPFEKKHLENNGFRWVRTGSRAEDVFVFAKDKRGYLSYQTFRNACAEYGRDFMMERLEAWMMEGDKAPYFGSGSPDWPGPFLHHDFWMFAIGKIPSPFRTATSDEE